MQQKPFDFKKYQKGGWKVKTRSGGDVRHIKLIPETVYSISAEISNDGHNWYNRNYTADGKWAAEDCEIDLVMYRTDRKLYANIYADGKTFFHPTEKQARTAAIGSKGCIAIARKVRVPSGIEVKVQR